MSVLLAEPDEYLAAMFDIVERRAEATADRRDFGADSKRWDED